MKLVGTKQTPCSLPKKPETEQKQDGKLSELLSPCPPSASSSLPSTPTKEAFINYRKLQLDPEKLAKSICKQRSSNESEKTKKVETLKTELPSGPPPSTQQCDLPKREPQQAQKKSWLPFKIGKTNFLFLNKI